MDFYVNNIYVNLIPINIPRQNLLPLVELSAESTSPLPSKPFDEFQKQLLQVTMEREAPSVDWTLQGKFVGHFFHF